MFHLMTSYEFFMLILIVVVFFWSWYQWKNRRLLSIARKLPTVEPTLPILGHLHHGLFNFKEFMSSFVLSTIEKAASQNIGQFCIWIGPIPHIFVMNSKDLRVIFTSGKTLEKNSEYDLLKFAAGNGLLTAEVHTWKQTRRHVQSLFHPQNLEYMVPKINRKAKLFVERLPNNAQMKGIEILHKLIMYAVDNVLDLIYGPENADNDPESQWNNEITAGIVLGLKLWAERITKVWLRWDLLFQVFYKNSLTKVKSGIEKTEPGIKLLREKLTELKETTLNSVDTEDYKPTTLPQIFAQLIQSNSMFSEKSLQDEIVTLVGAGADANSIIIASSLLSLACYPDIQEQVFNEISAVCGKTDSDVLIEDLQNLKLLERVLKEANRRFAPVPAIGRKTAKDLKLSFGTVPAGCSLFIAIYGVHMDSVTYPDPYNFDPDRFLPDNGFDKDKFSYIPFSSGPRNCIGKDYAMLTMKIFMVHILRRYKISAEENYTNMTFKYQSVMVRKGGYPIYLERRK